MKTIHTINKWSFILTIVLYTTIIGGLLAQIFLGCIQFVLALSIINSWKKLDLKSKKLVRIYWILFITYWIVYKIMNVPFENSFGFIFFIPIPLSIAAYFVYTTYKIKKMQRSYQNQALIL